jgi:hypothetical protein
MRLKTETEMTKGRMIRCLGCGAEFSSEELLIAWLEGKIPNPISCPVCGDIEPSLMRIHSKARA